jgi:hypothetical protein
VGVRAPTRQLVAAVLVSATLTVGCSSSATTRVAGISGPPASEGHQTSASEPAPAAPLTSRQCAAVNDANVDLLTASDNDGARRAANTLASYDPPASVNTAIQHFVGTVGAHFDDPDYPSNYKVLDNWLKQVCPAQ